MKRILLILRMRLVLSFFFLIFSSPLLFAQIIMGGSPIHQHQHDEKCGAVYLEQKQAAELGIYGTPEYFESWMQGRLQEESLKPSLRTMQEVRRIPVVVHVIHNGTPVGEGANIPLAQIQSQIRTLNEDFRRQNADAANTPAEFLPVAADAMIEFVLARQDPEGLPTTGINRVLGFKDVYEPADASLISSLALWPPEEYLNIWVITLSPPFIGYASFPIAPDLPGLNFQPTLRERDGVTSDYRYFGTGGNAVTNSRGRTLTHEVGHFFGLRHIWGDAQNLNNGCEVDDFVPDTPNQQRPTSGCPTNIRSSCDSRDMIENYMDYTADPCMNLFTQGQVERMNVVLASSERRNSLINNRATVFPDGIPNLSLSMTNIINPDEFFCENPTIPQIQVRNLGLNTINSVVVTVRVNGATAYNQTIPLSLPTGDIAVLNLNPIVLNEGTANLFEVEIIQINGGSAAQNASPNLISSTPSLQPSISLPYQYAPGDINNLWSVINPEPGSITWAPINLTLGGSQQEAIYINNYENEEVGAIDYLVSPQFDLTGIANAQLSFDIAHSPYNESGFDDRLWIVVSTDCGSSVTLFNSIYQRESIEMQTAAPTRDEYFPASLNEFRKELVNLSEYAGQGNVRVAFISINGFGNNIFLRNIRISTTEEFTYGFRINSLISPSPIVDGTYPNEVLELHNTGNLPISSFLLSRQVNNASPSTFIAQGNSIPPGETVRVSLPRANLLERTNRLSYTISRPNFDQNNPPPPTLVRFIIQNTDSIQAPWREDFNEGPLAPWQIINPENNQASFNFINLTPSDNPERALELHNFLPNNSYWLGSPIFDLSRTPAASILFDKAYSHEGGNARLRVLLSTNGGTSFEHVLLSQTGAELSSVPGTSGVNPNNPGDFVRQFVDLTPFARRVGNKIRVAIVVDQADQSTNPIYIDNLELFFTNNPDPVIPRLGTALVFPNPASEVFNVAFNLEEFEDVNIQFISLTGQLVHDVNYPNTLNQTYSFSTQLLSKGVFIVKIRSRSLNETRRLIIK